MWDKPMALRPHHGLCMAFFQGKGYSGGFTAALAARLEELEGTCRPVALTVGTDAVCAPCPHNVGGVCTSAEKTAAYDRAVLEACGLGEGAVLAFSDFTRLVQERIISPGLRRQICGSCQWDGLCSETSSRWAAEGGGGGAPSSRRG